ncbi:hypothetical protein [Amycolatopsis vancoresmycina]|uniref:Uncharacterized protein n=1 Tax=Amycolatopsis vancoresmycina DSM 44592 TaxID=1292037 RepID=R1HJ07_9PSEU|nr:hypothetical protein [Amycolatopsis vancoresmycina]EOD63525.1 hypothetical protein H480_36398 [Amycolatopsis vancoresmycina DSM 44592]
MGIRTGLVAAAIVAGLTAVTGAAAASAAAPAAPSSARPDGKKDDGKKDGGRKNDQQLAKVAASLHVTVKQLTTALENLKRAVVNGTGKATAIAAFAEELGITVARAEKVLEALSGTPGPGKPGPGKEAGVPVEVVKLLAAELKISEDRARQVFKDLDKVGGKGDDVTKDPVFIAIAKGLGTTPQRLLDALRKVKEEFAEKEGGKPKDGVPSGK